MIFEFVDERKIEKRALGKLVKIEEPECERQEEYEKINIFPQFYSTNFDNKDIVFSLSLV